MLSLTARWFHNVLLAAMGLFTIAFVFSAMRPIPLASRIAAEAAAVAECRLVIRSHLRTGAGERPLRIFVMIALACLSACSWFTSKKTRLPEPTEIVVTGAPAGSIVFVDGVQTGQAAALNDRPQILNVAAGSHKVEIHLGDAVVYREDTYVALGEHRMVRVLSGLNR